LTAYQRRSSSPVACGRLACVVNDQEVLDVKRPADENHRDRIDWGLRRLAENLFLTVRNEMWNDPQGCRSGYASAHDKGSIGAQWWPNKLLMMRPEIRFERSFIKNSLIGLVNSSSLQL